MNKVKITIGDWSEDGHSHYDVFVYESNKTVEEIRQAYKDSCKLTGISFNHNEDYTGLNVGYGSERQIATEYDNPTISKLAEEIFLQHGIDVWEGLSKSAFTPDDVVYIDGDEHFIEILVKFIKLSLPDLILEEGSFKKSELSSIAAVNGWWNPELNCQFGYGLYSG